MNPILPARYFVPDVEARRWSDGRLYLYGSLDIGGDTAYCSDRYHVFSSDDLEHWVDHGPSFDLSSQHSPRATRLYAPDCVERDGRYHLFYCGDDGSEGIAVAERPGGPFGRGVGIAGADGDGIDPAVLVDDDGQAWLFWGQFELRGARLSPGMTSIDWSTFTPRILTEKDHGFHEGASIRRRGGLYYLVYTDISRGRATALAYATSRSPLGPYEKRGIVVDNAGCDPKTWNNHGSIAEFDGRWYVFYHRSSQASEFNRRACIEPIAFAPDGSIAEVPMTTQGASPPLPATTSLEAWRACHLSGKVRAEPIHRTTDDDLFEECLTGIHDGDRAAYRYLDFGDGVRSFSVAAGSAADGGRIEARIDHLAGPFVAAVDVPPTGGWKVWRTVSTPMMLPVRGVHALHLVFRGCGGRLMDLSTISFDQ
jgi:hypothetical protein